jgi:hypothetical protein
MGREPAMRMPTSFFALTGQFGALATFDTPTKAK